MNETVQNLVQAIRAGDALETENAFTMAMQEKLSAKLDDMRQSVAQSMFTQETELDEVSLNTASRAYSARVNKLNKSKFDTDEFDDNYGKASDTLNRISKKHGDTGKQTAVKKAGGYDVND